MFVSIFDVGRNCPHVTGTALSWFFASYTGGGGGRYVEGQGGGGWTEVEGGRGLVQGVGGGGNE